MTLFLSPLEAFLHWEKEIPNQTFLLQPNNGKLIRYTYKEAGIEIRKIASKIQQFGLEKRSHIALLSKNCAHWMMSDIAIMMAGHVSIPIYTSLTAKTIKQVLTHSESKAIIVGKLDDYNSIKKGIPKIPIIGVELYDINEEYSWEKIIKEDFPEIKFKFPKLSDTHTIIYTSGTSGEPKGVIHSVENFVNSLQTIQKIINIPKHPRLFSYLPLVHVAERVIWTYGLTIGAQFSYPESLATFAKDLERTQPHAFFAVPRIWVKFQEIVLSKISQKRLNWILKTPILNNFFISKLKQKLGLKQAEIVISGAAPVSVDVINWYKAIDIEIFQIYGMTEDCCISHFNLPPNNKIGTVGKKLPGVKTKISEEGEILIKNNCLMKGYYKNPELTAKTFDEKGYLKTGDKGAYDNDGNLTITGRIKDRFKTDKGKYISPSPIELVISKNPNVEQVCVVGTGLPHPIALVTISEFGNSNSSFVFSNSLIDTIHQLNFQLEKHEEVKKVVVFKNHWTIENNFLTPTLKLKRNLIELDNQSDYLSWYSNKETIIFK
jgi:long-chain acyl-CoA synthetase